MYLIEGKRRSIFFPPLTVANISFGFRCNTDLTDNELELNIIQGINYNVPNPKEVDTYVRFEFPWPSVSSDFFEFKQTHNPVLML